MPARTGGADPGRRRSHGGHTLITVIVLIARQTVSGLREKMRHGREKRKRRKRRCKCRKKKRVAKDDPRGGGWHQTQITHGIFRNLDSMAASLTEGDQPIVGYSPTGRRHATTQCTPGVWTAWATRPAYGHVVELAIAGRAEHECALSETDLVRDVGKDPQLWRLPPPRSGLLQRINLVGAGQHGSVYAASLTATNPRSQGHGWEQHATDPCTRGGWSRHGSITAVQSHPKNN